ncbi:MAG: hypothetical protein DRO88_04220, partial [Promethearchaeia archaeon]
MEIGKFFDDYAPIGGFFYFSRLFLQILSQNLEHSPLKELSQEKLFIQPNKLKIKTNPSFQKFFQDIYIESFKIHKNPFFWSNFFSKFDPPQNNARVSLVWPQKELGSVHFHKKFYNYRFSWMSFHFAIILDKVAGDLNQNDRTQRQKYYFQLPDQHAFHYIEEKNTFLLILNLIPLEQNRKGKIRGSHFQFQITKEIVEKWSEFIQNSGIVEVTQKKDLNRVLLQHLTIFTKESTFSVYILNPQKITPSQFAHFMYGKIGEYIGDFSEFKDFDWVFKCKGVLNPKLDKFIASIYPVISMTNALIWKIYNKPPLILENHYCISLDLVPESFYLEILCNRAQVAEWKELFPDLIEITPIFTDPISINSISTDSLSHEILKNNSNLMIDTRHFSDKFTKNLLSTISQIESYTVGWIIQSDNRKALPFLMPKFAHQIDCIYTDPPYNTGGQEFTYHDVHHESDWIHMIDEILDYFPQLGSENLNFFISIDDNEYSKLDLRIREKWSKSTLFGPIVVQINKGGRDYLPLAKT